MNQSSVLSRKISYTWTVTQKQDLELQQEKKSSQGAKQRLTCEIGWTWSLFTGSYEWGESNRGIKNYLWESMKDLWSPRSWKRVNAVLIFKKREKEDQRNYRSASLPRKKYWRRKSFVRRKPKHSTERNEPKEVWNNKANYPSFKPAFFLWKNRVAIVELARVVYFETCKHNMAASKVGWEKCVCN